MAALDPFVPSTSKPWNAQKVQHLYQRIGFGASLSEVQAGLTKTPSQLVDQLVNAIIADPIPAKPFWAEYTAEDYQTDPDSQYQHSISLRRDWIKDMINGKPKAKLALFWSNHFVTSQNVYGCNRYLWDYYELLNKNCIGNFRTFTKEISKNSAMLVYLNGNQNIADEPNENYARELLELFTLGEGNGYTQFDVPEVARALTGWRVSQYECLNPYFDIDYFDNKPKTIFGKTANYTFDTLHDLIFTEKADLIAKYICTKLYKFFLYQTPNETVVNGLADILKGTNFELAPVLRKLFKSEHFFEQRFINAAIKSPLSQITSTARYLGFTNSSVIQEDYINYYFYMAYELGQALLDPPNVAGWPGYHAWINESTLAARWNFSGSVIYTLSDEAFNEQYRNLAIALSTSTTDPLLITQGIAKHFLNSDLRPEHIDVAVQYFKAGIPQNYFDDGSWNIYWNEAPYQIRNLLFYLTRLPEFQLT